MATREAVDYIRAMAIETTRFGAAVAYRAGNGELTLEDYQELGNHEGRLRGFLDALLMLDPETAREVVPIVERMVRDLAAIQSAAPPPGGGEAQG
jgi:hypothetical protein